MQLPNQQQQAKLFAQKMDEELGKVTMSWSNALHEWHPLAIEALNHASVLEIRIPQGKYGELLETNVHGINMNIVALLSNNLEARSPIQMGKTIREWAQVLELNNQIAQYWEALCAPIRERVRKEFEIMQGRNAGLKIVKAEA